MAATDQTAPDDPSAPVTEPWLSPSLQWLGECIPDIVHIYDASARLRYLNRVVDVHGGPTADDLLNRTPSEASPERDGMSSITFERAIRDVLASGEPSSIELSYGSGDGDEPVIRFLLRAARSAHGEVHGVVAIGRDITDLVRAHRELAGREMQYRSLAENLPDVVLRYDLDGRGTYVNHQLEDMVNNTAANVIGRRPTENVPPGMTGVEEYERCLMDVLTTGEPASALLHLQNAIGERRIHSVRFRAERDADGSITGAIAIGRDVTDIELAHQAIAEREREFRTLAENLPDVVLRYDAEGRATYVNHRLDEIVDTTNAPMIGHRPTERQLGSVDMTEYERCLMNVLATGEPGTTVIRRQLPSGEQLVHSILMNAERDDDGNIVGAIAIGRDVTELEEARQRASNQERELRTLAENLPDIVVRYDHDARARYFNREMIEVLGRSSDSLLGRRPTENLGRRAVGFAHYEQCIIDTIGSGVSSHADLVFPDPSGTTRTHYTKIVAERDDDGVVIGALAIGRDVTELVQARHDAAVRERQFRSLAENATDFITRWDTDGRRLYVNPAVGRLHGMDPETMVGGVSAVDSDAPYPASAEQLDALQTVVREGRELQRTHVVHDAASGRQQVHDIRWVPEFDAEGTLVSVLSIGRDVTAVAEHQQALEHAARTDPLTGIPSRQALYGHLPGAIAERRNDGGHGALLLIDLDGFKAINDQYGHRLGDSILCEIAALLESCAGDADLLARLGGDEFVLVVSRSTTVGEAELLADEVRMLIARLGSADDTRIPPLDASVGIAMFPQDGEHIDELLAHADLALYEAKNLGRGRVHFFEPELREAMSRRTAIERALRACEYDAELSLELQPICTLGDDPDIWGAEALLRWTSPTLGAVTPCEFIPIAENSGDVIGIGRWVLHQACALAVEYNRDRPVPLRITVNASTRQFTVGDIGGAVRTALDATGCDPTWLVIELTESLLLEDLAIVSESLDALHDLGVGLAIDDFGTGFSALEYLTRLRIEHMKIDKSFVHGADVDRQRQEIARVIVALGEALDIGIVAEGIETVGQADFLRSMGCGLGQGYLLAEPMPPSEFANWLRSSPATLRAALGS